jgi:hypothetical protein
MSILKLAVNPDPSAIIPGGPPDQFVSVFQEPPEAFVHVPSAAEAAGASRTAEAAVRRRWRFRVFMVFGMVDTF